MYGGPCLWEIKNGRREFGSETADDILAKVKEFLAQPEDSDSEDDAVQTSGVELGRQYTPSRVTPTNEQWRNGLIGGDGEHTDHEYYSVNLGKDFRDKDLQVIIKLSGIELKPDKPEYSGGNWHQGSQSYLRTAPGPGCPLQIREFRVSAAPGIIRRQDPAIVPLLMHSGPV
jgi:hypothetical protein